MTSIVIYDIIRVAADDGATEGQTHLIWIGHLELPSVARPGDVALA